MYVLLSLLMFFSVIREKAEAEAAASAAAEDKEVESDDGLVIGEKVRYYANAAPGVGE